MAATHSLDLESSSSQYASIADASCPNLEITSAKTWECWFKPESIGTMVLMGKVAGASGVQIFFTTTYIQFYHNGTATNSTVSMSSPPTAGVWQHVAGVYDTSTLKIYINGELINSVAATGSSSDGNGVFYLGRNDAGSYYDGLIRNARVWSVARTQQEIRDNMNVDIPVGTGLQGNWILNNSYTDSSGNGYTLTASGSPTFSTTYPDAIDLVENKTFTKKHKITVQHTQVAGSANLTDVPIVFTESNFLSDIFTNSQGSEINTNFLKNDSNLKAYYRFESGAETTDSSGNSHTLTAINTPTFSVGKFGQSVDYASASSQGHSIVDHADLKPTGNYSVGAWFKTSTTGAFKMIFTSINAGNTTGLEFRVEDTNVLKVGHNTTYAVSPSAVTDGLWHFGVGTYDGTNIRLYIDGKLVATQAKTAPTYNATNYVRVGARHDGFYFNGSLDDVFLLNGTALSAEEIRSLYAGGQDLRFSSDIDGKTRLAHEIVSFDKGTSKAEVWVKANTLDFDDNTDIYVHYGNATASALDENEAFGKHQVYPSKFRATYHTENAIDSTSFSRDLTNNNSVTFSSGKIGKTADFGSSNTNKYLFVANDLGITGGNITLLCWVKVLTEIGSSKYDFVSQGDASTFVDYHIRYDYNSGTRRLQFERVRRGTVANTLNHTLTLGTSDWYHLALTYNGTNIEGYVNGVSVGTAASSGNGNTQTVDGFGIGADTAVSPSISLYASSLIDQVQVVNTALSTDEIQTLYNNQNNPATFAIPQGTAGGAFLLQFV